MAPSLWFQIGTKLNAYSTISSQKETKAADKKNLPSADDGNVLNILARALLERRAAIKEDDEDEDGGELWE